jgi:hypothetical protein
VLGQGDNLDELGLHGNAFGQDFAVDEVAIVMERVCSFVAVPGYSPLMSPVEAEDRERLLAASFAASVTMP